MYMVLHLATLFLILHTPQYMPLPCPACPALSVLYPPALTVCLVASNRHSCLQQFIVNLCCFHKYEGAGRRLGRVKTAPTVDALLHCSVAHTLLLPFTHTHYTCLPIYPSFSSTAFSHPPPTHTLHTCTVVHAHPMVGPPARMDMFSVATSLAYIPSTTYHCRRMPAYHTHLAPRTSFCAAHISLRLPMHIPTTSDTRPHTHFCTAATFSPYTYCTAALHLVRTVWCLGRSLVVGGGL